jgi:RNA polymerase sigma-70 factor (ECF subfamily)
MSPGHSQALASTGAGIDVFQQTAWSMILQAQHGTRHSARTVLELLVQRYWRPVFVFVRRMVGNHEHAEDVTQGFFTTFLERGAIRYAERSRGTFRNFLIASVKRYMHEQHRAARARPAEVAIPEMDAPPDGRCFTTSAHEDPARTFMKNWAQSLVETCLVRLREELVVVGKEVYYDVFRRRFFGSPAETYRQSAAALGISEKDVNNYLERAKKRFARILRAEVQNSLLPGEDPDAEIRDLLGTIAR